ncbi:serine hydrolase [Lacticaseibacillus porcinae]|uniref:serine hydrolase n=1 Tax=Lacticaseibacillus porcinae TaxID=1123687 RepID=UPI0013DD93F6|nr:serine hydrolase [Lacticaseibacillus porcinae]
MKTIRELWQFLRTHRLKRKVRWALIAILAVVLVVVIGGVAVNAHDRQAVSSSSASSAVSSSGPTTAEKKADLKKALQTYFDQQAAGGKVQLSLYSLDPEAGSAAAKKPNGAIDGKGTQAVEAQGNTKVLSASTYKLYIAAYVFHRLAQKQMSWTLTDKQNFDAMIVNSENGFAQTVLTRYGNDQVDQYLQSIGLGQPFAGDSAETTANNLVKVLQMLDAGSGPFKDQTLRARLLKDMGKQIYRNGIPAGIKSVDAKATVQDKVGFLPNTNNDAGIVTTKDGHRYILVIMTTGREQLDFSQIKTIAAHIQTLIDTNI